MSARKSSSFSENAIQPFAAGRGGMDAGRYGAGSDVGVGGEGSNAGVGDASAVLGPAVQPLSRSATQRRTKHCAARLIGLMVETLRLPLEPDGLEDGLEVGHVRG